jgi:hypothetical protein
VAPWSRWTLDGRLVARQLDAESIVVRIGFAERERLLAAHLDTFFVPPRFDAHMKVVARLPGADAAVVGEAVRVGWEHQRSVD